MEKKAQNGIRAQIVQKLFLEVTTITQVRNDESKKSLSCPGRNLRALVSSQLLAASHNGDIGAVYSESAKP